MCELLAVRSDEPFELADVWSLAEGLERYGLAGFGWGAAWIRPDGRSPPPRRRAFRDDPRRDEVGRTETTAALVHLRRPSRFSTLGMADTQPFLDPAGRFGFTHNGDLAHHRRFRAALPGRRPDPRQGRHRGRDTLAGGRLARGAPPAICSRPSTKRWAAGEPRRPEPGGRARSTPATRENPVFTFRLGRMRLLATGIYSLDRSLFRLVAPGAPGPAPRAEVGPPSL